MNESNMVEKVLLGSPWIVSWTRHHFYGSVLWHNDGEAPQCPLTLLMLLTLRFLVFVNRATVAGQHEEATPTHSHSIQRSAFFMALRGILKRSSPWHILIRSDRSMNVSRSQRSLSVGLSRKTPFPWGFSRPQMLHLLNMFGERHSKCRYVPWM